MDALTRTIPLTQDQVALVDTADYEWLSQWKWTAAKQYRRQKYVPTRAGSLLGDRPRERIIMAREILGLLKGDPLQADHINFDTLDNRRCNLQAVSAQANKRRVPARGGFSHYVGVTWDNDRRCWRAQIQLDQKMYNLGRYAEEEEAARARDRFVLDNQTGHHLNFPS